MFSAIHLLKISLNNSLDINLTSHSLELGFFLKGLHHIDCYKYGQKNEQEKIEHTFYNVIAILTRAHELCC